MLSVIIPTWSATPELVEMALALGKQVKPMCDELVISEDGVYDASLEEIADIYLIHPRLGHGKNLAIAFQASSGEFVAIMDSDIIITHGDLRNLCLPGRVVTPVPYQSWGWFFVSPRTLIEEYPFFDLPGPEGIDHWWRVFQDRHRDIVVHSDQVDFIHLRNRSYGEWGKQERAKHVVDPLAREVASDRHQARLASDIDYATLWGNEEGTKGKKELSENS